MSAQHQWPIEGLDLATAFLQTQPTEADERLWTTSVEELREALGVGSEAIMRILRNIYGSTTATARIMVGSTSHSDAAWSYTCTGGEMYVDLEIYTTT